MTDQVPRLIAFAKQRPGFQMLVYSGTTDIATVPHGQTAPCLARINGTAARAWTAGLAAVDHDADANAGAACVE